MKELFPFYSIGHFINQPENKTAFEITRFETMEEPDVDDIHKHTFYEILWIEKGKSGQIIDYKKYEIASGTLVFISPNQVHQFEDWQKVTGGSIMFTEDFFLLNQNNKDRLFELSFLDNFYTNPCIRFNKKDFAQVTATIHLLAEEHGRQDRSQTITQSLLHILMAQVQRCIDKDAEQPLLKKHLLIYKSFKVLLDKHFQENKTAAFFADLLNITQHHLNHIVKEVSGKTTTEVIRARSTLEAKRLLTFSDYSVAETAAALGYFDSSYFAKIFKLETGLAPKEFKSAISVSYRKR
ncbi:MAG: helix-turn-helix domain-containing protein [Chitinophagaceae bacterium]|nr:helix-turn-helix domain-containing protein [Chitinophagaceae bacterium]